METTIGYSVTRKFLHWAAFSLIAAQYIVGAAMPHVGRDTLNEGLVAWHLSIGAAIIPIVVIQFCMRLVAPVPLLSELPAWQKTLAALTHIALYLLVLTMTGLGWAAASFRGWTVKLFGLLELPSLAAKGTPWAHTAGDIHDLLVYVLLGFICLHVLAALYHHFIGRDDTLKRMTLGHSKD